MPQDMDIDISLIPPLAPDGKEPDTSDPIRPDAGIDFDAPAFQNLAVGNCAKAWQDTYKTVRPRVKLDYTARKAASQSYRLAMPPLSGHASICDFIACVGQGLLMGVFDQEASGKLLYAAQVALSAESKAKPARPPA